MISQTQTTSFKVELLSGIHNFSAGGDTFKIALYTANDSLGETTTTYTSVGEVSGVGYTAGGRALSVSNYPASSGTTAFISFADVNWPGSILTARGALIYNSSKANRSVAVLDFGSDKTATSFTITFPLADSNNAIIRIT